MHDYAVNQLGLVLNMVAIVYRGNRRIIAHAAPANRIITLLSFD